MAKNDIEVIKEDKALSSVPMEQWLAEQGANPIVLKDAMEKLGFPTEVTPAEELVDQPVILRGARKFPTKFPNQSYDPYFVTGIVKRTGEVFGSAWGGAAVVSTLDALISSGLNQPLECVLRYHEGKGKFEGYYTLE